MVITLGVTLRIYNIQWPPCESHICRRNILLGVKVRVKVRVRVRVRIRIRVRVASRVKVRVGIRIRIRVRIRVGIRIRIKVRVRVRVYAIIWQMTQTRDASARCTPIVLTSTSPSRYSTS